MNTRHTVVVYRRRRDTSAHEQASLVEAARRIAVLRGEVFGGAYDPAAAPAGPLYFVPNDTLTADEAGALGIRDAQGLFGGVVPHPFVATKCITHPLAPGGTAAPAGWTDCFASRVRDVVLPGYSVFSRSDALDAGLRLLASGPVRLKKPSGIGGLGQSVVCDRNGLEQELERLDAGELSRLGLVLERNLVDPDTCSVGQVRVAGMTATYFGRQCLTADNSGQEVYGGSVLTVVRGGFEALMELPLEDSMRLAIEQARTYHTAAMECFSGMFASRCNYDIAQGADEDGRRHSGVLEQSWRLGGASGAELAALAALQDDPSLRVVRASTTERYGERHAAPHGAELYYAGNDDKVGPIIKYAMLERHGDS